MSKKLAKIDFHGDDIVAFEETSIPPDRPEDEKTGKRFMPAFAGCANPSEFNFPLNVANLLQTLVMSKV